MAVGNMETLSLRFPLRFQKIIWVTMIKKFINPEFHDLWDKTLQKCKIEMVQELAYAVQQYSKSECWVYGQTPLHVAAWKNSVDLFQHILERVEDKNPKNKQQLTLLHLAARYGHVSICQMIIGVIEDKNTKDVDGATPLHEAVELSLIHI